MTPYMIRDATVSIYSLISPELAVKGENRSYKLPPSILLVYYKWHKFVHSDTIEITSSISVPLEPCQQVSGFKTLMITN